MHIPRFRFRGAAKNMPPDTVDIDLVPKTIVGREEEYGASGTSNYNGYLIQSEFNHELRGIAGYDTFDEMRRTDPTVRETLWYVFSPILNANWMSEPPEDPSDEELEATEFIRCAFFEWMDEPFAELMRNVLSYLEMGNAAFETAFKTEERSLIYQKKSAPSSSSEDGMPPEFEKVETPVRQFVTWRKFAHRLPRTIWRWNVDEFGDLLSIIQLAPKGQPGAEVPSGQRLPDGSLPIDVMTQMGAGQDWKMLPIPAQYLVVFTHEKWGDEWAGISIMRAAYKPWWLKNLIERTMGLSYERYGVGVPVAFIPQDREEDSQLIDKIEDMLTNLRAGEENFLIFPGPEASGSRSGYGFKIESPGSTFPKFTDALEYLRAEIAGAMLSRFQDPGTWSSGNRSTASVQSEVWYNMLHSIARYIEDVFAVAIRRLVDMNYPGMTRYPRLHASGIEARDLLAFAQAVTLLTNGEVLLPDTPLRAWARDFMDAPPEDPDEARARAEQAAQMTQATLDGMSPTNPKATDLPGGRGPETEPTETKRPRVENAKG